MTGFGLILPLLPYYAESFDAKPFVVGLLVASFAAASLLGAPLLGRLSDRYGRRRILLLSVFGTFIGYLFLGFAPPIGNLLANLVHSHAVNAFTIGILFFSRIIDGLTAGNIPVAQAYISDITDETHRSRGLGVIGSAFGLGYIIGPVVGGVLSQWNYRDPAFAAAMLAFLNMISILFFLPEPLSNESRAMIKSQRNSSSTYTALIRAIKRPRVVTLLLVRLLIVLAYTIFWSVFALFAKINLDLSLQSTCFVMTFIGFYSVVVQGFGISLLTKRFKENTILNISLWIFFLGLIGWSLTTNVAIMLLVILPLAGGAWTLNTILISAITKAVHSDEVGYLLGISAATDSITRMIAPILGGFLLGTSLPWMLAVVSAAFVLLAIWFAHWRVIRVKELVETQPVEFVAEPSN